MPTIETRQNRKFEKTRLGRFSWYHRIKNNWVLTQSSPEVEEKKRYKLLKQKYGYSYMRIQRVY